MPINEGSHSVALARTFDFLQPEKEGKQGKGLHSFTFQLILSASVWNRGYA